MQSPLADKARAGRRAALAALNARLGGNANVVSFYAGRMPARRVEPEFHSVRNAAPTVAVARYLAA